MSERERFTQAYEDELRATVFELRVTARSCKGTVCDDDKAGPLSEKANALESIADRIAAILRSPEPIEAAPGYEVVRSSPNGTALWIRVRGVGILRFNRARLNPDAQNAPEEPIGAAKYDADGVPVGLTSVQALAWALKLRPDPVAEPIEAVPSAPVADAAGGRPEVRASVVGKGTHTPDPSPTVSRISPVADVEGAGPCCEDCGKPIDAGARRWADDVWTCAKCSVLHAR